MAILIDECVEKPFADYLLSRSIDDILCIPGNKQYLGMKDDEIIRICLEEDRVLVTCDKGLLKWFKGNKLMYERNWNLMIALINYYVNKEYLFEEVVDLSLLYNHH